MPIKTTAMIIPATAPTLDMMKIDKKQKTLSVKYPIRLSIFSSINDRFKKLTSLSKEMNFLFAEELVSIGVIKTIF